jgi:hypothetical protein
MGRQEQTCLTDPHHRQEHDHNLVQTLSVKLDSSARHGLYQDDAKEDGFDDCAELFGQLAESKGNSIQGSGAASSST